MHRAIEHCVSPHVWVPLYLPTTHLTLAFGNSTETFLDNAFGDLAVRSQVFWCAAHSGGGGGGRRKVLSGRQTLFRLWSNTMNLLLLRDDNDMNPILFTHNEI